MKQRLPFSDYAEARIARQDNGCWLWTGVLLANPRRTDLYGIAIHHSLTKRKVMAHRAVYEWKVGPIPEGMQLDHLCRTRQCVNPDHLEPVTQQENIRRGDAAPRDRCVNGHPYDEKNTYVSPAGARQCRACKNERQKDRYRRLRSLAAHLEVTA